MARFAGAVALGGAVALAAGGVSFAADEPATATAKVGSGLGIIVGTDSDAVTHRITLTIGDKELTSYCINFHSSAIALGTDDYTETSWDKSGVADLGKIQWVLAHGYPTVGADALLTSAGATVPAGAKAVDIAYAGTQAAIWNFSDNLPLKPFKDLTAPEKDKAENADVYAAIQKVFDFLSKNASDLPEPKPTLTITPATATGEVGTKVGPFTVTSGGIGDVALSATGGSLVDKDGKPVTALKSGGQFWVTGTVAGKVTITATGNGEVPAGRVFTHGKAQKLILAGTAGTPLSASASATLTPKTPGLPVTGASVTGAIGAGVLLLVGGGLGIMVVRRRRIRFTA